MLLILPDSNSSGIKPGAVQLDRLGDRITVLASGVTERAADQVDDTRLDHGIGERRSD